MLLDQSAILSDKQVLKTMASSANTLDLAAAGNAVQGALYVVARLDESLKGATKLTVALQTADTADFSNAKELVSVAFGAEHLAGAGELFRLPFPLGAKRYVRAYYTVAGTPSAGKVSCFVTDAIDMK
ncbi:Bbp16 family capsid cement protein [Candidatus Avelusimicrobium fimicolum]|uniref:Bbp16 family capsid cement protein n=1 Tax=Candidatus Avelusimicrobium fimicolum TaxID=3416216 RepID=UPI003D11932D